MYYYGVDVWMSVQTVYYTTTLCLYWMCSVHRRSFPPNEPLNNTVVPTTFAIVVAVRRMSQVILNTAYLPYYGVFHHDTERNAVGADLHPLPRVPQRRRCSSF